MKIAVEGCAHGDLENIYATLQHLEAKENIKIDLLICCGDFQATRNEDDLGCMACPDKYKSMCTFYKYYSGEELAPYPTLFVGGNHEASNYLWELYYGGWAAPRIYFLGFAGVVRFGGLRIGGISGIYKANHYLSGHYEQMPYNSNDMRSIYHIREYEVHKLMQIEEQLDIFISHDWPRGIAKFGNVKKLVRQKPFLEKEVTENTLGSKPGEILLNKLKPSFWFAAHLHTKYAALVQHDDNSFTKFLALDKCLPKRNFLQVIDIPTSEGPLEFHYDEEWLAITKAYNCFFPFGRAPSPLPPSQLLDLKNDKKWIQKRLLEKGHAVPTEFSVTVPPFNPNQARKTGAHSFSPPTGYVRNPFTLSFLQLLELPYLLDRTSECASIRAAQQHGSVSAQDPNEVVLDDEDDDDAVPDDVDEVEAEEEVTFQRRNGILSYDGES